MPEQQVKILGATYNAEKEFAKIKVKDMESRKEFTWALIGSDFDNLITSMTGTSLAFSHEQRDKLCDKIIGMEIKNIINYDIDNPDIDKAKTKNLLELRNNHDVVDRYPFYEIQQEAIEESLKTTEAEKNES